MATAIAQFLKHNAIALVALFLALGGTSYAATQLAANSVGTQHLKNNAVTTPKIKNGAVTTAKIANNAVTGAKVLESSLGTVPNAQEAESLPAPAWQNLSLLNGWQVYSGGVYGGVPSFTKDAQGFVHLRGALDGSARTGSLFAALPSGFRPVGASAIWLQTAATNADAVPRLVNIEITSDGLMSAYPGSGANMRFVSLEGITFRAQ